MDAQVEALATTTMATLQDNAIGVIGEYSTAIITVFACVMVVGLVLRGMRKVGGRA